MRPSEADARTVCVVVVCEAAADQQTACTLAERILPEPTSAATPQIAPIPVRWSGLSDNSRFLSWADAAQEARRARLRIHGHFAGSPGAPDAHAARRTLVLIQSRRPGIDAVLLIRDSDGDEGRRVGLQQAREERKWPFEIAIGVAHPTRECWLLAAFDPNDEAERQRFGRLKRSLKFDPCSESHRLRARKPSDPRSAKRVLAELTDHNEERAAHGISSMPLQTIRNRGKENGLAEYLDEVTLHLAPLFA